MHKRKDFWFWFGLILGPMLIVLALFNLSYLLAGVAILRHALKRSSESLNSNT